MQLFWLFLCWIAPGLERCNEDKWNGLKVTWGPHPFGNNFDNMPRTVTEAMAEGFHKISDCDTDDQFRGERYILGNDYAVVLLFDVNGYIAGMQTSFPDNQPNGFPKYKGDNTAFQSDGSHVTLTAYFVNPTIICTTGRSAEEFASQGTGTNLYLQLNRESSVLIPREETAIRNTKWTLGKCFPTMGTHYWLNLKEDMSCDDFFPYFLLYNSGVLTGFGFALATDLDSPRYEHPGKRVFGMFMKKPPQCLYDVGRLSTMHVYLTNSVARNLC